MLTQKLLCCCGWIKKRYFKIYIYRHFPLSRYTVCIVLPYLVYRDDIHHFVWVFFQNDTLDFFTGFTLDLEITTRDFVRPENDGDENPTNLDAFPVVSISGPSSLQVNGPEREREREGEGEGGAREKREREREERERRESREGEGGENI